MRSIARTILGMALLGVPAYAQTTAKPPAAKPLTVDILNAQGKSVGTATLTEVAGGVKIKLDIKSLPPGPHSMHIHEFPKCEPPDFKSAGPHFNAGGDAHSGHDHKGLSSGDIPNFFLTVAADGTAHTSVVAPGVSMGSAANSVFSNGGTSIVIHEVATEVTASAPARMACAVIAKPQ